MNSEEHYYTSWIDRLSTGRTFRDWNLHRPQIRMMLDKNAYTEPSCEEVRGNEFVNFTIETPSSSDTDDLKAKRLGKRFLLVIVGLLALLAVIIPIVIILTLPKHESGAKMGAVDITVRVQNRQYIDAFVDKDSTEYREFVSQFCDEVETLYLSSYLKDSYDGCLVTDLRNGSVEVLTTIVFQAVILPLQSTIRLVLTSNTKIKDTGATVVALGVFELDVSAIDVGELLTVDTKDNPSPKIAFGDSCRLSSACKTYQGECLDMICSCGSERYHDASADICILYGSAIGGKCSTVGGCNIPNAICEGEACACISNYKIQDGACVPVTTSKPVTTASSISTPTSATSTTTTTDQSATLTPPITTPSTTMVPTTTTSAGPTSTLAPTTETPTTVTPSTATPSTTVEPPPTTSSTEALSTSTTSPPPTITGISTKDASLTTTSTTVAQQTTTSISLSSSPMSTTLRPSSTTSTIMVSSTTLASPPTSSTPAQTTSTAVTPPATSTTEVTSQATLTTAVTSQLTSTTVESSTLTTARPTTTSATPAQTTTITPVVTQPATSTTKVTPSTTSTTVVTSPTTSTTAVASPTATTGITKQKSSTTTTPTTSPLTPTTVVTQPTTSTTTAIPPTSATVVTSPTTSTTVVTSPTTTKGATKQTSSTTTTARTSALTLTTVVTQPTTSTTTAIPLTSTTVVSQPTASTTSTPTQAPTTVVSQPTTSTTSAIPLTSTTVVSQPTASTTSTPTQAPTTVVSQPTTSTTSAIPLTATTVVSQPTASTTSTPTPTPTTVASQPTASTTSNPTPTSTTVVSQQTASTTRPLTTLVSQPTSSTTSAPLPTTPTTASQPVTTVSTSPPTSTTIAPPSSKSTPISTLLSTLSTDTPPPPSTLVTTLPTTSTTVAASTITTKVTHTSTSTTAATTSTISTPTSTTESPITTTMVTTSTTVPTSTTTTPLTSSTITTLPSTTMNPPVLSCTPMSQSAMAGDSRSFSCYIEHINTITHIQIPELDFDLDDETGINGVYSVNDHVTLVVDASAVPGIVVNIDNVTCSVDGNFTIKVNNRTEDTLSLIVMAPAKPPSLLPIPEVVYVNQVMEFTCRGEVGRIANGSKAADLEFEIKMQGTTEFQSGGGQLIDSSMEKCTYTDVIQMTVMIVEMVNGTELRCVARDRTSKQLMSSSLSGPLLVQAAGVNFNAQEYNAIIGDQIEFTCSFNGLPGAEKIRLSRDGNGDVREEVVTVYQDGNLEKTLSRVSVTDIQWGSGGATVSLSMDVICGDETRYYCGVDGVETITFINVFRRPEKPTLTLSLEIVDGQVPSYDRYSECIAETGHPAGVVVVEVMVDGTFEEYNVTFALGYPRRRPTDCGTEEKIKFYFSNLTHLDNTQTRCTVKNTHELINETLSSDPQTIYVIPGNYCSGIYSEFYPHPKDCYHYVDCTRHGSLRVTKCPQPNTCPNQVTGCDEDSCSFLCNRDPSTTNQPELEIALECSDISEGELRSTVNIHCILRNADEFIVDRLEVYHDDNKIFDERGNNGTVSSSDGDVFLVYTNTDTTVVFFSLRCDQDGIYSFIINSILLANASIVVKQLPSSPVIEATRFVVDKEATITCQGSLGKPQESRNLVLEAKPTESPEFVSLFDQLEEDVQFDKIECSYIKTVQTTLIAALFMSGTEVRCRLISEVGNFSSDVITVTVETQALICNKTADGELGNPISLTCNLVNADSTYMEQLQVYHSGNMLFDVSDTSGTVASADGSVTLIYTSTNFRLNIPSLRCEHDGVYTFIINSILQDTATVVVRTPPSSPTIDTTRFVNAQETTITCESSVGKPQETRYLILEARPPFTPDFMPLMDQIAEDTQFNNTECAFIKTLRNSFTVAPFMSGVDLRCRMMSENVNISSNVITVTVEDQEVEVAPITPMILGQLLSLQCTVYGVSDLTTVGFYRQTGDNVQRVCQVENKDIVNDLAGVTCTGRTNLTNGNLEVQFTSLECTDDGQYTCEPNPEASTPRKTTITVTSGPSTPYFAATPLTLVANTYMLSDERLTCEGNIGYPQPVGRLLFQRDRIVSGIFDEFTITSSMLNQRNTTKDCQTIATNEVGLLYFDMGWNNSKIRCAIEDQDGTIGLVSEEFTIQLLEKNYCEGKDEYTLHPYQCHNYIECSDIGDIRVRTCDDNCPLISDGIVTCSTCTSTCS